MLAFAWQPATSHAITSTGGGPALAPPGDYYVAVDGGDYDTNDPNQIVSASDPFAGGYIDIDPLAPDVAIADITTQTPSLTFTDIVTQEAVAGNEWEVDLQDTTNSYDLTLILDNWSNLIAGADGATIDPSTQLVEIGVGVVGDDFSGNLDVPAPPGLPVFVTALGLMAFFAWRRKAAA
jgi:hypothetical protein